MGKKQSSAASVDEYRKNVKANSNLIEEVSILSEVISKAKSLIDFDKALAEHEKIISSLLGIPRIKDNYFSDFSGEIKSLGAWGGDFVLATYDGDERDLRKYFQNKGNKTILRFDEMVL